MSQKWCNSKRLRTNASRVESRIRIVDFWPS